MYRLGRRLIRQLAHRPHLIKTAGTLVLAVAALTWPTTAANPAAGKIAAPVAGGDPPVGALFSTGDGHLESHFCTASVIDSPAGNLLATAAHCVSGYSDASPAGLAFVPAFDNGRAPYGIWTVTRVFVGSTWASSSDPDDDVAFLEVSQPGSGSIQDITGGETLGIGRPAARVVRVTGYPNGQQQPISCQNQVSAFGPGQLEFDCASYTDGTSGSAFLANVNPATGQGTVIGVLGGYEQGGDTPDVSYAAVFGSGVQALYDTAIAQDPAPAG